MVRRVVSITSLLVLVAASAVAQPPAPVDVAKVTTEVKATVDKYYRLFTSRT
jgi:hypothetical protein